MPPAKLPQIGDFLYKVFDGLCCQSAHPLVTLVITTFLIVVGKAFQEGKHHLALFVDKIAMVICKGIAYLGG